MVKFFKKMASMIKNILETQKDIKYKVDKIFGYISDNNEDIYFITITKFCGKNITIKNGDEFIASGICKHSLKAAVLKDGKIITNYYLNVDNKNIIVHNKYTIFINN